MPRAVVVFRNNAIELAHSQRGLVQQAAMLEERLEAERQLTALQRNFVSMASHEFRTPPPPNRRPPEEDQQSKGPPPPRRCRGARLEHPPGGPADDPGH